VGKEIRLDETLDWSMRRAATSGITQIHSGFLFGSTVRLLAAPASAQQQDNRSGLQRKRKVTSMKCPSRVSAYCLFLLLSAMVQNAKATVLIGDQRVEGSLDHDMRGQAEGFPVSAFATGNWTSSPIWNSVRCGLLTTKTGQCCAR
jgi:hypothetical protein